MAAYPSASKLGGTLRKAVSLVGSAVVVEGLFAYLTTLEFSTSLAEGDALKVAGSIVITFATLPAALLTQLTQEVIFAAKESGYEFVAGSQDPWDLIDGIYTATGRAWVSDDHRKTLDQLVQDYKSETRLKAFVLAHCQKASQRDLASGAEADAGVAEKLYDRCYPVIRRAWQAKRDEVANAYFLLARKIEHTPVLFETDPEKLEIGPGEKLQIKVQAFSEGRSGSKDIDQLRQYLNQLVPGKGLSTTSAAWVGGEPGPYANHRVLTVDKPGTYPLTFILEVTAQLAGTDGTDPLFERFKCEGTILLDVVDKARKGVYRQLDAKETFPSVARAKDMRTEGRDGHLLLSYTVPALKGGGGVILFAERKMEYSADWTPLPRDLEPGKTLTVSVRSRGESLLQFYAVRGSQWTYLPATNPSRRFDKATWVGECTESYLIPADAEAVGFVVQVGEAKFTYRYKKI